MLNASLALSRFLLAAWVGAATLFVITSVREVRTPEFDATIKDRLAATRFPAYYACGFTLVGGSLLLGVAARRHPSLTNRRLRISLGGASAALVLMVVDYVWIYGPMRDMIDPPGSVRPASFITYHWWSEGINTLGLACCLVGGLALCWSGTRIRRPLDDVAPPNRP